MVRCKSDRRRSAMPPYKIVKSGFSEHVFHLIAVWRVFNEVPHDIYIPCFAERLSSLALRSSAIQIKYILFWVG